MKIGLIILLILAKCLWIIPAQASEQISISYITVRPLIFPSENPAKPLGALVDFFEKEFAPEMGILPDDIHWEGPLPFPRILQTLKAGEIDCTLLIVKTPERETYTAYADQPYFQSMPVLLVLKSLPLEAVRSVEDVIPLTIGLGYGTRISPFIKENIDKLDIIKTQDKNWIHRNLDLLQKKRLNAIYSIFGASLLHEAKIMKIRDQVRLLTLPESPEDIYFGFSKKSPKGMVLLKKCNEAIKKKENLTERFNKILRTYTD